MNKEPLGLYIFRLFAVFGIFVLLCMLYWSSALLEQDIKGVDEKLEKLNLQVSELKNSSASSPAIEASHEKKSRSQIDPNLPNLLEEDPFYATTLPKLLGKDFKAHGKMKFAFLGKPENLHPFSQWAEVIEWTGMCSVSVARLKYGHYETLAPDMAIKMELRENKDTKLPEYWIHLRDDVFYEPLSKDYFSEDIQLGPHFFEKHQVTAYDYKFYFDAIKNPHVQADSAVVLRSYLADLEELKVIDDFTFVVRWKVVPFTEPSGKVVNRPKYIAKQLTGELKPLASFVYKYFPDGTKIVEDDAAEDFYRTNSIWAQNFTLHFAKNIIVSCGPWIFDGMSDRQIQFRRNRHHYNPYDALTQTRIFEFKQSDESIWEDFQSNNLDSFSIRPDQLIEYEKFQKSDLYQEQLKKGQGIQRLDYVARRYVNIQWNEAKPFFKSKKVRQALTMSIDRRRIIKQNLNGLGIEINGPFFRYSKSYDESIKLWPFDPQLAKTYLEEEGWYDKEGTGVISKEIDGKRVPFSFSLMYYVKNALGKTICEYIATALKEVGIDCKLNGVDIADLSAAFEDKSFDALFFIWGLGSPPEDPEQLWLSTLGTVKGSSNAVGFANRQADEIIHKLKMEYDEKERIKLYHQFDQIIHDEQPYTFLFTPKTVLLYRQYVKNVFIPADRQDILPGADIQEPDSSIWWTIQDD